MTNSAARWTLKAAGLVIGATAVLGASPAFAKSASIDGATVSTRATEGHKTVRVYDTLADGVPSKGEYYRSDNPNTKKNLWNKSGNGSTVSSTGASVNSMRACKQNDWGTDPCSGWIYN